MSLVILDYDDTLFPTTYYQDHQDLTEKDFNKLDKAINKLIKIIFDKNYDILIVSNGSIEWIKYSVNLLPSLKKFLDLNIVGCVSARDTYENTDVPYESWKHYGIVNILTSGKFCNMNNIVGIGDAVLDYKAVANACKYTNKNYEFIRFTPEMNLNTLTDTINKFSDYFKNKY